MRAATITLAACVFAALLSPAFADNDKGKGKGHGNSHGQGHGQGHGHGHGQGRNVVQQGDGRGAPVQYVVVDRDRTVVRTYYRNEYVAGNCPPGLAKKNNGCLPPGQAKKMWLVGQPLPPTIVYYPLPPILYRELTPPPIGYEYVRVDNDIVMLVVGTRLVVGALANLGDLD